MTTAAHHGSHLRPVGSAGTRAARPGLVTFAGVLLALLGFFNGLDGIAAIANSHVFVGDAHYVFGDLRAWGWVMLALAVVQVGAAYGVLVLRASWARWTGVVVLGLNAFAQMAFLPSYPLWSLTIIAIDVVAIYGLTAYTSTDTSNRAEPLPDLTAAQEAAPGAVPRPPV
ncbi:DUF7144 family membrane protein [Streptacidiphilus jiangxiensis]|uniref:DUF7144 domain-containing protein n=1 Tax=Streptacidiphilus jiangxiensis TaxID=235985 RepID=A0A1H7T9F3_STRJI|nr:hypothetical protein [Streptacidiphilus jiangxiensis]SEL81363.1 hypothetical protein SAMN05414137_113146 [Streptacidiphilus jiangxiensis]